MEIKAYRARFVGKESLGVLSESDALLDVMLVKEEPGAYITDESIAFAVRTHDRGNAEQISMEGGYYQIAFKIVYEASELEAAGLQADDLKLILDKDHGNPLYHDRHADLWYQQTFFKPDGRPLTNNDIENDKRLRKKYAEELRYVDSIRTAGVFSVCLKSKRDAIIDSKKIYVLPSLIDTNGYKYMLDRLLSIHERLVVSADSAVGIGGRDAHELIHQFGNPQYDAELWQRLKPEIHAIMHMPAILQQKCYHKLPHYKLRRFDSRVMSSYIRSGGQWAEGVVYADDHDTQENRIIKHILQRFTSTVLPAQHKDKLEEAEIERQIIEELKKQFNPVALDWYKSAQQPIDVPFAEHEHQRISFSRGRFQNTGYQNGRKKRIYFKYKDNKVFEIRTNPLEKWNTEEGSMTIPDFTYYPLSDSKQPCGLCLTTEDFSTALEIILVFSRLYEAEKNTQQQRNQIDIAYCGSYSSTTKREYYGYGCGCDAKDVTIITIDGVISCRFSGDNLLRPKVSSLYELYREILNLNALKYMEKAPEMEIVEYVLSRRAYYSRMNSHVEAYNKAASAHSEIQSVLSDPWFTAITSVHRFHFQQTPLFLYNPHYRAIYNTLHEIIQHHPMIISNLDENLFGAHETTLIYEYWVFYGLLNRLLNLGFVFDGNTRQVASQLRNMFVDHLLHNLKPEGFAVCMHRDIVVFDDSGVPSGETAAIEIMVGYNCVFGDQKAPAKKQYDRYLTPDFFIRVTREDGYHWYFLDAKYEEYTEEMLYKRAEKGKRKNSISDVCYDKYTVRMQEKHFIDDFAEFHREVFPEYWKNEFMHKHSIEGAYLVIARYDKEQTEQITISDRLFGSSSHGILGQDERPMHRLGSIVLRPGKEDELTTLLELIFEYKEGCELIDTGTVEKRTNKDRKEVWDIHNNNSQITQIHTKRMISLRPKTLFSCWDSSNDHTALQGTHQINISPQLTKGKGEKYKFYITCSCGSRRYENYCICPKCRHEIIKHDKGNYHFRKSSQNKWNRWNYVCPHCGSDIDPSETEELNENNPNKDIDYSVHIDDSTREPPPLTEEEFAALIPPESPDYDNWGCSY